MQQMARHTNCHNNDIYIQATNLTRPMGLLDASCCFLLLLPPVYRPEALLPLLLLALLHELNTLLDAACQLWQHFVVVLLLQVVHGAQRQEFLDARPA
jgi:hypothetical protein